MQGRPFIWNGKTLISGLDPVGRADRSADAVSISDKTLYFCPSPLYGYGLERFLSRLKNEAKDSVLLCVEAESELFELTLKNTPLLLLQSEKLHITNVCNSAELVNVVNDRWPLIVFRRLEIIRFTGGWQLHSDTYNSLCDILRREIAAKWSNTLTLAKLGRLYIRNALRNLAPSCRNFKSVSELNFGKTPVLVLGAGPSLDAFFDTINNEQNFACPDKRSFKIICVDSCLGALRDRGIVPDLVVILESQHWNIRGFLACREWNVPAAIDISALPASASVLSGETYMFFTPWTNLRIFKRLKKAELLPAQIPPLGSVGLTAVELARKLTSGKVICAGLDFSFTHILSHARGTPGHHHLLSTQTRFRRLFNVSLLGSASLQAVSKSGFSVRTNPIMKNYRNFFEYEFGSDERIYDIEGSGLPLGVKTLSLEEALEYFNNLSQRRKGTEEELINKNYINDFIEKKDIIGQELCVLCASASVREEKKSKMLSFFKNEKKLLEELKNILTGETPLDKQRLNTLVDECDYLWAHFPDCAGLRRPCLQDAAAISFLKRLRAEIDPMLRIITHPAT
ncbi:MAG: DUF115 domain-containing protein [Treponema sp.]|jgi:hypothetical protein|nr:DUF115 domain-containing protein [Treponema sp.]